MALDILYLTQEDVVKAGVLDVDEAIRDVEEVLRMVSRGEVVMPPKIAIDLYFPDGSPKGHLVAMPAYLVKMGVAGIKWAAGFFKNPELYNLPHGIDVVILSDPESGRPLAIMDGTLITAMRTGAIAGVAVKYLAPEGAEVLGVIGAGVIGRTSTWATCRVFKGLSEVRIYDLRKHKAEKLAEEIRVEARVVERVEDAVRGCDVVITATTSHSQFVKRSWLKDDCLCVEMGKNEFEDEVVLSASRIIVDYWDQVKSREWVSLTRLWKQGLLDERRIESIVDIIGGRCGEKKGLKFFSPIGMACEDLIVAWRIYRRALREGLGERLHLWKTPLWI